MADHVDVDELPYSRYERTYLVLASIFVVTLVLTNVIGIKLFRAPFNPEFALTTGIITCLLYTSPSPRDGLLSRMPSSA